MKVIFNADDFGLSRAVNYGIVDAHINGVVNSTTALVKGYAIEHAVELSKKLPTLKIGIHFALTFNKSLLGGSSITDKDGAFYKYDVLERNKDIISYDEVLSEFRAQLAEFVRLFGFYPDHIDSHHHVHLLPIVSKAVQEIAKELSVPVRCLNGPEVYLDFYSPHITVESIIDVLSASSEAELEIMVHPGYVDNTLVESSSYVLERTVELETLTSPKLINYLNDNGIEVISFSDLGHS